MGMTEAELARYWSKVRKDEPGCWLWLGPKQSSGYGQFPVKDKSVPVLAHRLSWWLLNGEIPAGLIIMHSCDVKTCVNPAHLSLGTQADNMRDAALKGRMKAGQAASPIRRASRISRQICALQREIEADEAQQALAKARELREQARALREAKHEKLKADIAKAKADAELATRQAADALAAKLAKIAEIQARFTKQL